MKKIISGLLVFSILVSGCQKSSNVNDNKPSTGPENIANKPIAGFRITNTYTRNSVMELTTLNFENTSVFGESYLWDFGDGQYSTDRVPSDVFFAPCMRTVTIKLTVKNSAGESSTSQSFFVQCGRMGQPHPPVTGQY